MYIYIFIYRSINYFNESMRMVLNLFWPCKKIEMYKAFEKKSCKNYKELEELYGTTMATSALRIASIATPLTSFEEHQLEKEFFVNLNSQRKIESSLHGRGME